MDDPAGPAGLASPSRPRMQSLRELEATEAYEKCRLLAVDRRFRRVVPGVHWQQLRLEPLSLERGGSPACLNEFRERLDRATARVRSGKLAGCRRLVAGPACCECADKRERVEASFDAARALTDALAALSAAPAPLEEVCFTRRWRHWPREAKQRELGIAAPRPLDDVARSFLAALRPAPLRSLQLEDRTIFSAFVASATPGCFPLLRELRFKACIFAAGSAQSRLVEIWPGLKRIACTVQDGDALRELAKLPLEELRVHVDWMDGLEEALEALDADCVRELHLPGRLAVGPRLLASLLRLRNLEELTASVDRTSGDALAGLGALQKLRSLTLHLNLFDAPSGGEGVLRAAAAGLSYAPRLGSLSLKIDCDSVSATDPGCLASLLRAAGRA
eukprot:tig00000215_g18642.t1